MRQRVALVLALAVGVALRLNASIGSEAGADAGNYARKASEMSWWNPWGASYREPLWELLVKVTTAPFGYRLGALQVVSCVVSILALLACVWALRQIGCRGWTVVAGTAALAVATPLVVTAGTGMRESTAALASAVAVGLAARSPGWVPILGAVMLAVRWEMGLALLAVSVTFTVGRVVEPRRLLIGGGVAVVLVGPFLVNNGREYGDPMFHSNTHATFYANMERVQRTPPEDPLPMSERIAPDVGSPLYRVPLVSWSEYVTDTVGIGNTAQRVADATAELPVEALRLGRLPWAVGLLLYAAVFVVAVWRRDRVVLLAVGLAGATVVGYGLTLPWFDRRLISHLAVLLVLLLCAGAAKLRADLPDDVDAGRVDAHGAVALDLHP